ncbi:uncharacterized protein LOC144488004 [Mustelus asterias]
MKGRRDRTETMADPAAQAPLPSSAATALLSGQELETWLEDLESVLHPSLPLTPSRESPGLKQLWLEDIENVLYPPSAGKPTPEETRRNQLWLEDIESVLYPPVPGDPAGQTQRLSQLLLDDLESILYPPPAGDPSEDAGHRPPDLTQVEFGSPDHTPLAPPLEAEDGPSDRLSTIDGGRQEDLFSATSSAKRGAEGDGGGSPGLQPRGGKSPCLPEPPSSPCPSRRGTKRRRPAGCCPCGRTGLGPAAPEVARLTAENVQLRRRIEELTAEVGAARARLIERMVRAR